ncbi:MAG: hypothetical protein GY873_02480 [Bosea sp.]|uniref:hypothetical protein n=1 Tax=Bosea sp. (in: a-proteobacteria) TaxID=1871050 RepID=UPI00239EB220|nr:hypothetical protein [Bosea sp. (in: a-proteobacteria)]
MASTIAGNFTDMTITGTDDAANSESLLAPQGDWALSGMVPDGREAEVYQSQGAVTGIRKGPRVLPTLSVSAELRDPSQAFHKLIMGVTAGFTSVSVDIGNYPCIDLDLSFDYGATARTIAAEDAYLTEWNPQAGSPNIVSMTFTIAGPVTVDGETYVSTR